MRFAIITDTSTNLPASELRSHDVTVVPFSYFIEEQECTCAGPDEFDGKAFYDLLRQGTVVRTALINQQRYLDYFEPVLASGQDVLFIGMSSGISGSMQVAKLAAHDLREKYPERKILVIDTMTASLGEGLFLKAAVRMRDAGKTLAETAAALLSLRPYVCSYFTVDDLMFLRRGGRCSNFTAVLGTVLGIKPLLKEDGEGHIIVYGKTRGRKKALRTVAEELEKRFDAEHPLQYVGIAHGDCEEDAQYVADLIHEKHPNLEIQMVVYEPVTGSHVGPGTVALFFVGHEK